MQEFFCIVINLWETNPEWPKFVLEIFEIALLLRDRHVFMWQSLEMLNVFYTLTLKQSFWKTETFFKRLEYRFLFECTKVKNGAFPCKTITSEINVKTKYKMDLSQRAEFYQKLLYFFKTFVWVKEACIKSWFDIQTYQTSTFMLSESVGFYLGVLFSVRVSLKWVAKRKCRTKKEKCY